MEKQISPLRFGRDDTRKGASLAVDEHLVVGVVGALDYEAAELDHDVLRGERAGHSELEDTRVRIAEPVVLDHLFCDDVGGQNGGAGAGGSSVGQRPLRDEWKLACL